jgi:hypothetical protein
MDRTDEQFEKFQSKIKQDIKVEFQKVKGESREESETVPEIPSEKVTPTETKVSSAKQRRIRKLRILKSLGIKISNFRKRLMKQIKSTRVKNSRDCHITRCKRNISTNPNKVKRNAVFRTNHKHVKPQSELTKNRKFRHFAFWTNPSQAETKRFQEIHHKVKSKKGNLFSKTQNTCEELTGGLGSNCVQSTINVMKIQIFKVTNLVKNLKTVK